MTSDMLTVDKEFYILHIVLSDFFWRLPVGPLSLFVSDSA